MGDQSPAEILQMVPIQNSYRNFNPDYVETDSVLRSERSCIKSQAGYSSTRKEEAKPSNRRKNILKSLQKTQEREDKEPAADMEAYFKSSKTYAEQDQPLMKPSEKQMEIMGAYSASTRSNGNQE